MQLRLNDPLASARLSASRDNPFHYTNFIEKVNSMCRKMIAPLILIFDDAMAESLCFQRFPQSSPKWEAKLGVYLPTPVVYNLNNNIC
jgi:hypothetical protein